MKLKSIEGAAAVRDVEELLHGVNLMLLLLAVNLRVWLTRGVRPDVATTKPLWSPTAIEDTRPGNTTDDLGVTFSL